MENTTNTELVAFNTEETALGTVQHFIDTSTREGKIKLYSALQNAEKLDEHLNEPLDMVTGHRRSDRRDQQHGARDHRDRRQQGVLGHLPHSRRRLEYDVRDLRYA